MKHHDYHIVWSPEDKEYVAMSPDYPSLSWLDENPDAAAAGLRKLLAEADADENATPPILPIEEVRNRYAELARKIPATERDGEEMHFLEELEIGEVLRIEDEQMMRVALGPEEWISIFHRAQKQQGRADISTNDFIQAIILKRNTSYEKARQAVYRLLEEGKIRMTRLNRLQIVPENGPSTASPTRMAASPSR